jgi:hypothetical protein
VIEAEASVPDWQPSDFQKRLKDGRWDRFWVKELQATPAN